MAFCLGSLPAPTSISQLLDDRSTQKVCDKPNHKNAIFNVITVTIILHIMAYFVGELKFIILGAMLNNTSLHKYTVWVIPFLKPFSDS